MKKKLLPYAISLALLLIAALVLWLLFAPRPIVVDVSRSGVIAVDFNPQFNQEQQDCSPLLLAGYDEAAILEVLSRYSEQRAPRQGPQGDWVGDIQLELTIATNYETKFIRLGNVNYSYDTVGAPTYNILEAEQLRAELMALLDTSRTY